MAWIVCAYFTRDAIYEKHAERLIESLKKFDIPYDIAPIEMSNDWYKATQYKPQFLLDTLERHQPHSIVYIDVDAIFCKYPILFDQIHNEMPNVNFAAYVLDHSQFRRKNCAPELLSGTLFIRNTDESRIILREWIEEMKPDPKLWDQCGLYRVLKRHSFYTLPPEYCTIFDYMSSIKNPVIKHFQASREAKAISRRPKARLRVVDKNNCVIKLGRVHQR